MLFFSVQQFYKKCYLEIMISEYKYTVIGLWVIDLFNILIYSYTTAKMAMIDFRHDVPFYPQST